MKFNTIKVLCFFAVFVFICGCGGRKQINTDMLKDGDIIFQNKKSKNSELLNILTSPEYNHMGVLTSRNGKWYVLEAAQPVELTPVSSWINSGDGDAYIVKRLKDADTLFTDVNTARLHKAFKEYLGKPYDVYFAWSDDSFYASELVWKIFKKTFDIELCQYRTLGDFDLTPPEIREKIKEVHGNKVPLFEEVISPKDLFESSQLITIMDNDK